MSRTTIEVKCNNPTESYNRIGKVLESHNYKNISENNENVWKNGVGFLTAMKYIKVEVASNNTIVVSGWIRAVAGSEQDLNGFVGAIPKKQVMDVIKEIQSAVV